MQSEYNIQPHKKNINVQNNVSARIVDHSVIIFELIKPGLNANRCIIMYVISRGAVQLHRIVFTTSV